MLSPEEQYARLLDEVRYHLRAQGRRATRLRWAYEAIREYAELWGHDEGWSDALMTELLNETRGEADTQPQPRDRGQRHAIRRPR